MSNLIRIGGGVSAAALALALGFAFWPQIDRSVASGRSSVEKPVFVVRAAPVKLESVGIVAQPPVTQPAVADGETAMAKLAVALRSGPSTTTPGAELGAARGLIMAKPNNTQPASDAARRLCAQGLVALAQGDIAGARAYLQSAADGGDARALLALGETYDPATLARIGARGIKGDAAQARDYYSKALAAGLSDARERMAAVEAQAQ